MDFTSKSKGFKINQSLEENTLPTTLFSLTENSCPCCDSAGMHVFYIVEYVPVHSVLLMPTREVAINYPRGDITLGFCKNCGFISNVRFNPEMHEYSSKYEETQGFSPTFNTFHRQLATQLINKYNLHNKDIIEIGCGKGEFLTMLCELGGNRGIGFDPAYVNERLRSKATDRIRFIKDFYSEKYSSYRGDFIICKMTLEHIHKTGEFVHTIRRSIGDRVNTMVFFQVPDVVRILKELAFWDIYYEHCSYFNPVSLKYLLSKSGFDIIDFWKDYDDQYMMLVARPCNAKPTSSLPPEEELKDLSRDVTYFTKNYRLKLENWKRDLQKFKQKGYKTILWGGGSKGVSFLTTLDIKDEIEYVVDINPFKHGTYMAGTGQKIVSPEFLKEYKPDIVIVMNPVYCQEIRKILDGIGLTPEIITV